MDTGLYVNLFEVKFEDCDVDFMVVDRNRYPKLRDLRQQLTERQIKAQIFAMDDEIYGYGPQQSQLTEFGFTPKSIGIAAFPRLASRLILEGYFDSLMQAGYSCSWRFGRAIVYQFNKALLTTPQGVQLFRGFQLQSLYLHDPEAESLIYGVVIDAVFTYRDRDNLPISPHEVVVRFGQSALRLLRTKQGDLAPRGGINLEVTRQRLVELVLPFVNVRYSFFLPCGIRAELNRTPIRIILAGEE